MTFQDPLPVDRLETLLAVLSPLAELVGDVGIPGEDELLQFVSNGGIESQDWAIQELALWSRILAQAREAPDDGAIVAARSQLQERGIPVSQAILAVDSACGTPITIEPETLDFGSLSSEETANKTLSIHGGCIKEIVVRNDPNSRLKVTSHNARDGNTLVNVSVSSGPVGESLSASIVLRGVRDDHTVPVRVKWTRVKLCPCCQNKSLFWNRVHKVFECLNRKCNAVGNSPENLKGPLCP